MHTAKQLPHTIQKLLQIWAIKYDLKVTEFIYQKKISEKKQDFIRRQKGS